MKAQIGHLEKVDSRGPNVGKVELALPSVVVEVTPVSP
jgi:hypothetical protein